VAVHHFARFHAEADFIKTELTPVQMKTDVDQDDPDSLYYGRMVPMPKTEPHAPHHRPMSCTCEIADVLMPCVTRIPSPIKPAHVRDSCHWNECQDCLQLHAFCNRLAAFLRFCID
jgi:hypothetical protein